MAGFCACNGTLYNTKADNKQRVVGSGVKFYLVPLQADDGTANVILSSDTLDQTFIDGKVYNTDASKRWYPVGEFKNQEDVRADTVTESFSDGSSAITQQGVRTYTGWLVSYAPKYIERLQSFSCTKFGVYIVDSCGGLTGSVSKDGTELKPIKINNSSWNPTYVKGTPTVSAKVQLVFEFAQTERDEYLRVISNSEIGADLLADDGILELTAVAGAASTTTVNITLTYDDGIFLNGFKNSVVGLVLADFAMYNNTTMSSVTITSVTETVAGQSGSYDIVYPAQTAADEVTFSSGKQEFNWSVDATIA